MDAFFDWAWAGRLTGPADAERLRGACGNNALRVAKGEDGRSTATTVLAAYPLKLLLPTSPSPGGEAAWCYQLTYGGGLVSGDAVGLRVRVDAGARLVLTTQGSTKVYTRREWARAAHFRGGEALQGLVAAVGAGGFLAVLPSAPVQCFAGAALRQYQLFDLAGPEADLVSVDWVAAGREAGRREAWAFERFFSKTAVRVAGRPLLIDALRLEGPALRPLRELRFGASATAVLVGACALAATAAARARLLARARAQFPASARQRQLLRADAEPAAADLEPAPEGLLVSASPLTDAATGREVGAVVRVLGRGTEDVQAVLADLLGGLTGGTGGMDAGGCLLGERNPYAWGAG